MFGSFEPVRAVKRRSSHLGLLVQRVHLVLCLMLKGGVTAGSKSPKKVLVSVLGDGTDEDEEHLRDLTDLVQGMENDGGFAMTRGDHVPSVEMSDG